MIISPHQLRGARIRRNHWSTDGLVAAWNPNVFPGGGTLYDRAGSNHLILVGLDWQIDSKGYGLYLATGETDEFTLSYPISIASGSDFTFLARGAFISIGTCGLWRAGATSQGTTYLNYDGNKRPYVKLNNQLILTADAGTTLPTTECQFAFVIRSEQSAEWYLNGALEHSDVHAIATPWFQIYRFGWQYTTAAELAGTYRELQYYNRALSASEIMALYCNPYAIWDAGQEEEEWAWAPAAGGGVMAPYYYRMLTGAA